MTEVTIGCAIANLALAIAKIIAGIFGRSAAMTADAIHSLSDAVCDGIVLVMVRISAKGKSDRYNWGRGKYETVATLTISVLLIIIAIELMTDGISSIKEILTGGEIGKPGMIALWVSIISILVQESIFRWTVHVGKAVNSTTMIANAWHHRSDALSSVGTLLGVGGAILLGGKWTLLDPLVGCIISIVILEISVKMLFPALHELTDGALPKDDVAKITDIILATSDGMAIRSLNTRKSGHCDIIDAVLSSDKDISISEASRISEKTASALKQQFNADAQISVVIEPV